MSIADGGNKKYLVELLYALDEENFADIVDAPSEWLMECYSDILNYGGSYLHIKRVLELWSDEADPRTQAFTEVALVQDKLEIKDSPEELLAFKNFAMLCRNIYYSYINTSIFPWGFLSEPAKGIMALQYRHMISDVSEFTMTDYNVMTEFIRANWGPIHPDDDPVLGMVSYPSFHALPIAQVVVG